MSHKFSIYLLDFLVVFCCRKEYYILYTVWEVINITNGPPQSFFQPWKNRGLKTNFSNPQGEQMWSFYICLSVLNPLPKQKMIRQLKFRLHILLMTKAKMFFNCYFKKVTEKLTQHMGFCISWILVSFVIQSDADYFFSSNIT